MPVVSPVRQGSGKPSCTDRMKTGFLMGFSVGMASGVIFGSYNCFKFGLRGAELLRTIGKTMVQGGFTFGVFMAIGTGIRC